MKICDVFQDACMNSFIKRQDRLQARQKIRVDMAPAHKPEGDNIREDILTSISDGLGTITELILGLDTTVSNKLVDLGPGISILMGRQNYTRCEETTSWSGCA